MTWKMSRFKIENNYPYEYIFVFYEDKETFTFAFNREKHEFVKVKKLYRESGYEIKSRNYYTLAGYASKLDLYLYKKKEQ